MDIKETPNNISQNIDKIILEVLNDHCIKVNNINDIKEMIKNKTIDITFVTDHYSGNRVLLLNGVSVGIFITKTTIDENFNLNTTMKFKKLYNIFEVKK